MEIDRKEIVRKLKNKEPLTKDERQDVFCDHILHDDYNEVFGEQAAEEME